MNDTTLQPIPLDGISVMIGMPAGRDLPILTVRSLIQTFEVCYTRNIPVCLGAIAGSAVVQWARDDVVSLFMKSEMNRLFWIDSDMVWEPDDFMRLLALSQKRDVICAPYPAKRDDTTFFISFDDSQPLKGDEYGLLDVNGTGLGFTVMRREVVEKLVAKAPVLYDKVNDSHVPSVFRVGERNGGRLGEDIAFFNDIRELGYKVLLCPDVNLGHMGTKQYKGSLLTYLKRVD